jgi:hypothetical protein
VPVDHRLESLDLVVGHLRRTVADADYANHAEAEIDRPPALYYAREQVSGEQGRGCALRLHQGQEDFEAVIHAKPLGSESFALRQTANDRPKGHGAKSAQVKT